MKWGNLPVRRTYLGAFHQQVGKNLETYPATKLLAKDNNKKHLGIPAEGILSSRSPGPNRVPLAVSSLETGTKRCLERDPGIKHDQNRGYFSNLFKSFQIFSTRILFWKVPAKPRSAVKTNISENRYTCITIYLKHSRALCKHSKATFRKFFVGSIPSHVANAHLQRTGTERTAWGSPAQTETCGQSNTIQYLKPLMLIDYFRNLIQVRSNMIGRFLMIFAKSSKLCHGENMWKQQNNQKEHVVWGAQCCNVDPEQYHRTKTDDHVMVGTQFQRCTPANIWCCTGLLMVVLCFECNFHWNDSSIYSNSNLNLWMCWYAVRIGYHSRQTKVQLGTLSSRTPNLRQSEICKTYVPCGWAPNSDGYNMLQYVTSPGHSGAFE